MTVRVSCGVEIAKASEGLIDKIKAIGIKPIVTPIVVRAVYEGPDKALGQKIVELYQKENTTDIYYDFGERSDEKCVNSNVGRRSRKRRKGKR